MHLWFVYLIKRNSTQKWRVSYPVLGVSCESQTGVRGHSLFVESPITPPSLLFTSSSSSLRPSSWTHKGCLNLCYPLWALPHQVMLSFFPSFWVVHFINDDFKVQSALGTSESATGLCTTLLLSTAAFLAGGFSLSRSRKQWSRPHSMGCISYLFFFGFSFYSTQLAF